MHNTTYTIFFDGIISRYDYYVIATFLPVSWTLLSLCGIVCNVINIITFVAMGLNDGVTVSFLALTIFDLTYVNASFCIGIASCFSLTERISTVLFPVEPYGVVVLLANIMIMLAVTNVLTTTFLAVARCMCVAKPLHFKNYFTVKRTVYFMSGFAIFAVTVYTPLLANMAMVTMLDARINMSRPTLWMSKYREPIKNVVFVITDMILPVSSQFIVLTCIIIMASSLRASSRFRQKTKIQTSDQKKLQITSELQDKGTANANITDKLSGKELRVVTQVTLISVVYVACNTPRILIIAAALFEPEFKLGRQFHYFYISLNGFRKHLEIINASVNTLIYFNYNSKFRAIMLKRIKSTQS
ncbi:unnamed protein product [Candidula unifasciata]|uniref:G-protein coupled receptors family 1 profile domain-containing protein n=1 Tax=Candidula unifasciata TaxID=100452 RepID=A0A8S3Z779_9EUPU|nr:unnamed protein product [Candidula unifasciata]